MAAHRRHVPPHSSPGPTPPPLSRYSGTEQALIQRLDTPEKVQAWLDGIPYNWERDGETLRSFRGVARDRTAHCAEAALFAAAALEQHGHPPLLLDLRSRDLLDHVVLVFQRDGRFGAVGSSREPGLEGRKPVYRNLHTLVGSYAAPYIDEKACINAYATFDLREIGRSDWRFSERNVWHVEEALQGLPAKAFRVSTTYRTRWSRRYAAFKARHPEREPVFYPNRHNWM